MIFYSAYERGFFFSNIHGENIPSDAVEITSDEHKALLDAQSAGKCIEADANGRPVAVDPPAAPVAELLQRAKDELRAMRSPMLDALTGISGRAVRAGNDALAAEADSLAEQLLDVTDDQELNDATTYEEMQAAGVAAYKRIAATASAELSTVFREITGA